MWEGGRGAACGLPARPVAPAVWLTLPICCARSFANTELVPHAAKWDREHTFPEGPVRQQPASQPRRGTGGALDQGR